MDIPVISRDLYIKDIEFERVREELYDVAAELGSGVYIQRSIRYIAELEAYVKELEKQVGYMSYLEECAEIEKIKDFGDTLKFMIKRFPNTCFTLNNGENILNGDAEYFEFCRFFLLDELMASIKSEVLGFCGCGLPDEVLELVKEILTICKDCKDVVNKRDAIYKTLGIDLIDEDKAYLIYSFFMYQLDHVGFLEHGSSIGNCWTTPLGELVLSLIEQYFEECLL